MSPKATDVMPIALALVMGSIACEFILPPSPPPDLPLSLGDHFDLGPAKQVDLNEFDEEILARETAPAAKAPLGQPAE